MHTPDKIIADWRKAKKELEDAEREYSKYIAIGIPLEQSEIKEPIPIPFDKLKAASDKLMTARGKERKYMMEYIEAVKKSES